MIIKTNFFGEIEISSDDIVHFEQGILGLEEYKDYALFTLSDNSKLKCLQSLDEFRIAFILINPWDFFKDYDIEIADEELERLQLKSIEQVLLYNIVTFYENIKEATANLLAPVVINIQSKKGAQIVLSESQYTTKHSIFPKKEGE